MNIRTAVIYGQPVGTDYNSRVVKGRDGRVFAKPFLKGPPKGRPKTPNPRDWRLNARKALINWNSVPVLTGLVEVWVAIYLPRPKSLIRKTKPMPVLRTGKKPDGTNVCKLVEDALTGLWWEDDSSNCVFRWEKYLCAGPGYGDERPRVEIMAREVPEKVTCSEILTPLTPGITLTPFRSLEQPDSGKEGLRGSSTPAEAPRPTSPGPKSKAASPQTTLALRTGS